MTLEGRNMSTIKDDEALYQNLKKKISREQFAMK